MCVVSVVCSGHLFDSAFWRRYEDYIIRYRYINRLVDWLLSRVAVNFSPARYTACCFLLKDYRIGRSLLLAS